MFTWLFKKQEEVKPSPLTPQVVANILAEFMHWYGKEMELYKGDKDRCALFNIATLHPNVLMSEENGLKIVQNYFISSSSKEQRVATRLRVFTSKIRILFGDEIFDALRERCVQTIINDYHIPQDIVEKYLRTADLFWVYPLLLIEGNIDLSDIRPSGISEE